MITYLKNENVVIKVNEEDKTLMLINNTGGTTAFVYETSLKIYADVTVVRKEEGYFVEGTEEDYVAAKEQAMTKISTF